MDKLLAEDVRRVVRSAPRPVLKAVKDYRLFLGGGCVRALIAGEPVNDWDLFGPTEATLAAAMTWLSDTYEHAGTKPRLHKTQNAITLLAPPRTPVQAITRWLYNNPGLLIESFDYTVARAVVWWDGAAWQSLCDGRFYIDLAARRLHYCSPLRDEDAGGSLLRAIKFLRRGYAISPESLGGVVARLMKAVDLDVLQQTPLDLQNVVVGLLREVDPLVAIEGLEVRDPVGPAAPDDFDSDLEG